MEEADFKKIQWETKYTGDDIYKINEVFLSKDRKYFRHSLTKTNRRVINKASDKFLVELKEKRIIPEWLYIYRDENWVVSENYPNVVFKKEFTAGDLSKITKKIKALWELDFSEEKYFNPMWATSLYFMEKSKYYYSPEYQKSSDFGRYCIRFAYIKCERIIRRMVTKNDWVIAHNNLNTNTIVWIDDEPFFVSIYDINLSVPMWDISTLKNNANYSVRLSDSMEENEIRFMQAFLRWLELIGYNEEQVAAMPQYHEERVRFRKIWEEFMLPYKKMEIADMENYMAADSNEVIDYFTAVAKNAVRLQSPFAYNELKIFHYHWIEAVLMGKVWQLWGQMRDHSPLNITKNSSFVLLRKYFLKNEANMKKLRSFMSSKDVAILTNEKFWAFYNVHRDGSIKALKAWATPKDYVFQAMEVIQIVAPSTRVDQMFDYLLFNDFSFSLQDRYALFQEMQKAIL